MLADRSRDGGTIAVVMRETPYLDAAQELMAANADAIRSVYQAVLDDPRTSERQRERVAARVRHLDDRRSADPGLDNGPVPA
jgi:hypothetical protein